MDAAVFLDRDNTIIANDGDLGDPEAVRLLSGVGPGLKALRRAGYRLIVVTNQGGVARGQFTEDDVDAVHQRIALLVDESAGERDLINRFYYCPYHPEGTIEAYQREHPWRKPHPGMLLQAARDLNLDLARCWMVGDQPRDVEAGRSAGCRTVLLDVATPNGTGAGPTNGAGASPGDGGGRATIAAPSFSDAVQAILRHTPPRSRSTTESAPGPPAAEPGTTAVVDGLVDVKRAIGDLAEELRSNRTSRAEFTGFRLAAGMVQLLAAMLALVGLLQLGSADGFVHWMIGAGLVQLVAISLLVMDLKE